MIFMNSGEHGDWPQARNPFCAYPLFRSIPNPAQGGCFGHFPWSSAYALNILFINSMCCALIEPACGGNLAPKLFVAHLAVATHAESGALHRVSGFLGERP